MSDMTDPKFLHKTTDASVWAREFCRRFPMGFSEVEGREGAITREDWEGLMIGWFANAIETAKDSMPAAQVAVKPLEWEYNPNFPATWIAESSTGDYTIFDLGSNWDLDRFVVQMGDEKLFSCSTPEEAKLRVQSDRDTRILSQIVITPGPDPEAVKVLVEALKWYADPEIYKPHPHGIAFDRRDLSYRARAALARMEGK